MTPFIEHSQNDSITEMENKLMVARQQRMERGSVTIKGVAQGEFLGMDGAFLYLDYIVTQIYTCGKTAQKHTYTYIQTHY